MNDGATGLGGRDNFLGAQATKHAVDISCKVHLSVKLSMRSRGLAPGEPMVESEHAKIGRGVFFFCKLGKLGTGDQLHGKG